MRKSDEEQIADIIQMLGVRKKQFVKCPRRLSLRLFRELDLNYPNAKLTFFGLSGGSTINIIRKSSAKTFKKS